MTYDGLRYDLRCYYLCSWKLVWHGSFKWTFGAAVLLVFLFCSFSSIKTICYEEMRYIGVTVTTATLYARYPSFFILFDENVFVMGHLKHLKVYLYRPVNVDICISLRKIGGPLSQLGGWYIFRTAEMWAYGATVHAARGHPRNLHDIIEPENAVAFNNKPHTCRKKSTATDNLRSVLLGRAFACLRLWVLNAQTCQRNITVLPHPQKIDTNEINITKMWIYKQRVGLGDNWMHKTKNIAFNKNYNSDVKLWHFSWG